MGQELSFSEVRSFVGERDPLCHKGMNGRGLLLAGSAGFAGAAVMCAAAALRSGVGTLKLLCPVQIANALSVLPEAMPTTFPGRWDSLENEKLTEMTEKADAVAAGPGMGGEGGVWAAVKTVLTSGKSMVLDADALNAAAKNDGTDALHKNTVITPHIGEMARLTGLKTGEIIGDMTGCALFYAKKWNCTVLLKSAHSVIAAPEGEYRINRKGNSGLAKGGSGDVLTGIILALLCQGLEPFAAACAGSYLLGASADEAFAILRERLLMARDIIGMVENTIQKTSFWGE